VTLMRTIGEALVAGNLILVAEDNRINQDVIRRQLNRLGYQCELAGDGLEALQLWRSHCYALLLTDCHMPEMDGFDLTRAIRSEEAQLPNRHTPIIAITANALKGEAERCLAAGMDDYLTKPLKLKSLQELLQKWMVSCPEPYSSAGSLEASFRRQLQLRLHQKHRERHIIAELPVLDERAIKDELGDDPVQFREILRDFHKALDGELAELQHAIATQNIAQVLDVTHKLKSACRTVGAARLARLCEVLELSARNLDWAAIHASMPGLPLRCGELLERLALYEANAS